MVSLTCLFDTTVTCTLPIPPDLAGHLDTHSHRASSTPRSASPSRPTSSPRPASESPSASPSEPLRRPTGLDRLFDSKSFFLTIAHPFIPSPFLSFCAFVRTSPPMIHIEILHVRWEIRNQHDWAGTRWWFHGRRVEIGCLIDSFGLRFGFRGAERCSRRPRRIELGKV